MKIPFTKMQGCANDYIYVNCFAQKVEDPAALSVAMSPRHFSVGADGLVLILPSEVADARMRMFNADGSEGKMCGNAIRCVGKYLYDHGICKKTRLTIETLSGIKTLSLLVKEDVCYGASVDMGQASVEPSSLPILSSDPYVRKPLEIGGNKYEVTCVSVGNPHVVVLVDDVANYNVEGIGKQFERNAFFPQGVNTEFVQVVNDATLIMRVWERGSGETYACGTGASAVVTACCLNGICKFDTDVTVRLLGGDLTIRVTPDLRVTMTGPAVEVYQGVYEYEN